MILVIGANGTVGREVVSQLKAANVPVRVLVRDQKKAPAGVEVVVGDLAEPSTLAPAFAGVQRLFLLSQGPAALENNAIDAAAKAGVSRIVKLSSMGFGKERDGLTLARWHRDVERHLQASGIPATLLYAGNFSSNTLGWAPTLRAQGAAFAAMGDGKTAPVDPRDLAAVGVAALTQPGHEGRIYELTGPATLTTTQQIAILGEVMGKPWHYVDVPPAAAREGMVQSGLPAPFAEAMLEVMAAIKAGGADKVTDDVQRVLGRPARSFADWARDHAAAFA
jgi:(4-alkanoyl-5-oxo-2,5-dihydrofuran-3-yl)methyl phosphate reductase